MPKPQLCPAYNAPAAITLLCNWDVWVDASFIYWQPSGENLELGIVDTLGNVPTGATPISGTVTNMDFDFKPGFQVGMGINLGHDDWDGYAQYTYLRSKDHVSATAPSSAGQVHSFWISPAILLDETASNFSSGSASWKANFDFVDAVVGRWYYNGRKLTFHPFLGLRGAFIRQRYTTHFTTELNVTHTSVDKVHSWGVGARMGMDSNWEICNGFRFYGCGAADILYTRYDIGSKQTGLTSTTAGTPELLVSQDDIGYLRPHIDLELGLGWGTDLDCHKWYIDFSAGYGFQIFFNQVMFRRWIDDVSVAKSYTPVGDLFMQGLTAKVRLDF